MNHFANIFYMYILCRLIHCTTFGHTFNCFAISISISPAINENMSE